MSQCVPSWDLDDNSDPRRVASSNLSIPSMEYQVAELTWENGQLAMHGLAKVPQRVGNKPVNTTWDKPRAGGTLESIVNQATRHPKNEGDNINGLVPWFDHHRKNSNSAVNASMTMTMDALVPCNNNKKDNQEHVRESSLGLGTCVVGCSTRVGSCSGARVARVGMSGCKTTNVSLSEGSTCGGTDSRQLTLDTCGGGGFTSPSLGSPENSSGKEYTKISGDDHDSVCHSRLQKKGGGEDGKKKGLGVSSSVSTKRSRAAAIHNQSERKRRDKINQRMKTLQKLVPNSSKTDKASMLDEVIEYLKQLQAQVHMISRMNMPSMMFPLAMQQQLQMSMMGMGVGMGMGMGVMDMNTISRAAAGMPPVMPPPAAFMPLATSWDNSGDRLPNPTSVMPDPFSSFLACQSQPMTMDVYNRLAAMQQQFQQNNGSGQKN